MTVSSTTGPSVVASSKSKGKAVEKKTAAKKAATKPVAKVSSHPSWKDIIKECIADNREDIRQGVSRTTIKKFAETKYKIEMTASAISQLSRAIANGAEAGTFVLPKGPSGKVKLAPMKPKSDASKENAKPPSKSAGVKKLPAKKPIVANKPAVKKTATTPAKAKSALKKPTSKAVVPKKTVAKKPAAATTKKAKATGTSAKKTSSSKTVAKRAAAKTAAAKPKSTKTKPASKKAAT